MASPLSPSPKPVTDEQIDKLTSNVRATLRKICKKIPSDDFQQALEHGRLNARVKVALGSAVRIAIWEGKEVVHIVPELNRSRTPQQLLDAMKRNRYVTIDPVTMASMPSNGTGVERNIKVVFFKLNYGPSDDELSKEFKRRGLVPDPYAQIQVNINDPAFANIYHNCTHWKDANGKWCFIAFGHHFNKGDFVNVDYHFYDWSSKWFGGVRKKKNT